MCARRTSTCSASQAHRQSSGECRTVPFRFLSKSTLFSFSPMSSVAMAHALKQESPVAKEEDQTRQAQGEGSRGEKQLPFPSLEPALSGRVIFLGPCLLPSV